MIDCYTATGDYNFLSNVVNDLPDDSELLPGLCETLEFYGLCDAAVEGYLKCDDVKGAVDCCVRLNRWDRAMQLAEGHNFPQIAGLLSKYGNSVKHTHIYVYTYV